MITQVGYAIGLLFIVPLGDLYRRKKIILTNFTLLIFSLIAIGAAPTSTSYGELRSSPESAP